MTWEAVFKVVCAIIISFGGAGAITLGIVRFGANHISKIMLKKYDAELSKKIEQYKHNLEMEAEKYRLKAEELTFVTKKQFETEFSAYQRIFQHLYVFSNKTRQLFPVFDLLPQSKDKQKALYERRYTEFCDAFNKYSEEIEINAPFIPKDIYDLFVSIRGHAHEIGCMYPEIRIQDDPLFKEDYSKITKENYQKTDDLRKEISEVKEKVRDYLSTLKIDN